MAEQQSMASAIEQALACPCLGEMLQLKFLGDLKEGACGPTFVEAFTCFMNSEHEDKGMDCLEEFKKFQVCLQQNPEHLAKIMEGDEERERAEAAAAVADAPLQQQQQQQEQAAATQAAQ